MSWNNELKVGNFSLLVFLPLIPVLTVLIPPQQRLHFISICVYAQAGVE